MGKEIIIIPDIHGRIFWENAVKDNEDKKIIFLGDYLDPYFAENISSKKTINNFLNILSFKKKHFDNVILLLGNHDCEYLFSKYVCNTRCDNHNYDRIQRTFRRHVSSFQLAYDCYINNKHFVFSHAGIEKEWVKNYVDLSNNDINDISKVVLYLNEKYKSSFTQNKIAKLTKEGDSFEKDLTVIDKYRQGWGEYASIIWADARDSLIKLPYDKDKPEYQIFGHTQLALQPAITEYAACLDVREGFYLDEQGNIHSIKNDEILSPNISF